MGNIERPQQRMRYIVFNEDYPIDSLFTVQSGAFVSYQLNTAPKAKYLDPLGIYLTISFQIIYGLK